MNRWGLLAIGLTIIVFASALMLVLIPAPHPQTLIEEAVQNNASTSPAGIADLITVTSPLPDSTVASGTLAVSGSARGPWYSEAVFPIELRNAQGTVIAQGQGRAQGEWMTTDFVPFSASLSYPAQPAGSVGTLVLKNDNPSGDPSKEKSVFVPVKF